MATRKFNPKRITGSFKGNVGGREFAVKFNGGFMDGSFVQASFNADRITEHVGSQGDVTLVLNADKTATVTVTLSQGAAQNAELSNLIPDADKNFLPVGALDFEDLNGNTKVKGPEAYIKTVAPIEYGNAVVGRAWVFGIASAELFVGEGQDF